MTVALNVLSRNEVAARPIPLCRRKINQKLCVVSDFQQNLEAPVITTTDMTEKDIGGGEGLLMPVCQRHPKIGESESVLFCLPIHPHPLPLFLLPLKLSNGYGREVTLPTRTCLGKLARRCISAPTLHRVPFICHRSGKQHRPCFVTLTFAEPCLIYLSFR
jgi:hypothetical protein